MIKKLRRKFILVTMSLLAAIFTVVIVILNLYFAQIGSRQSMRYLQELAQTGGQLPMRGDRPDNLPPEASGSIDKESFSIKESPTYLVRIDAEGEGIFATAIRGGEESDTENAMSVAERAVEKRANYGRLGLWRYYRQEAQDGTCVVVVMDISQSMELASSRRLLISSIIVGAAGLLLLFLVSVFLSRFVTKPAEQTFNRQRQFISDASHELKTPLSAIAVNADVLATEIGENKYLGYIQSETRRMDELVHQLLDLARADDGDRPLQKSQFDLSEALEQVLLPLESVAFEQAITYDLQLDQGVSYFGERESVQQVAVILADNALRHTPSGGAVRVSLRQRGEHPVLEVFNTGQGIAPQDLPHVFERFYRCDPSRTGDGSSYGLGLAIARAIVQAHGGQVRAESEPGTWARFWVNW